MCEKDCLGSVLFVYEIVWDLISLFGKKMPGTCLFLFFINRRPCGWVLFVKECARHVKFIVEILVLSRQYQFANPADYTTECLLYSSFL